MNVADVTAVVTALSSLAGDILEASARKGESPIDTIEALRASLRLGVVQSVQAELDSKFGRGE